MIQLARPARPTTPISYYILDGAAKTAWAAHMWHKELPNTEWNGWVSTLAMVASRLLRDAAESDSNTVQHHIAEAIAELQTLQRKVDVFNAELLNSRP